MTTPPSPNISRILESLIHQAAIDPAFKRLLLEQKGEVVRDIFLSLSPEESATLAAMISALSTEQLETIINQTGPPPDPQRDPARESPQEPRKSRRNFLVNALVIGGTVAFLNSISLGNRPDRPRRRRQQTGDPSMAPSTATERMPGQAPRAMDAKTTDTTSSETLQGAPAKSLSVDPPKGSGVPPSGGGPAKAGTPDTGFPMGVKDP